MIERRAVWALTLICVLCAAADTAISASFQSLLSQDSLVLHGWPLATLAIIGSSVMGALILLRYPGHVIGWLLTIVGAVSSASLLAETYMLWVTKHDGPGSDRIAHLSGWLSLLFAAPVAFAGFTLILLLVPDGRLLSARWRSVAGLGILGLATWTAGVLVTPPSDVRIDANSTGGSRLASALFLIGLLLSLAGLVVAVVSVHVRRRRASGVVRQQLRLISLWSMSVPFGLAVLLLLNGEDKGATAWLARMPLLLSYLSLPICLAIAVLRYRLWDIDVILNRAVVFACGTAFAAAGYVAVVVGVGALVNAGTGVFWPSILASVAVALAFQPMRRSVIRVADRLAYGERAAPYEALAGFSRQIGELPDPELLLPAVARAAAEAVSATQASVRLRLADGRERCASWPEPDEIDRATTQLPVVDEGETLGSIEVRMPSGRALRPADHALLVDLAGQTGVAFRNARLSTQIAEQVELLDHRTRQLALSRARVIAARDAESIRLERAIRRDVTSHLERLPGELAALSRNPRPEGAADLRGMIADAVAALEALRALTRGVYSTQLAQFGLASAVSAHLRRAGTGSELTADEAARRTRFSAAVESAAYFCYVRAAQELPAPCTVDLSVRHGLLVMALRAAPGAEPDLVPLQDRLDPLGGDAAFTRTAARSVLTIRIPVAGPADADTPPHEVAVVQSSVS